MSFTYGDIVIPVFDGHNSYSARNCAIYFCVRNSTPETSDDRLLIMVYSFSPPLVEIAASHLDSKLHRDYLYSILAHHHDPSNPYSHDTILPSFTDYNKQVIELDEKNKLSYLTSSIISFSDSFKKVKTMDELESYFHKATHSSRYQNPLSRKASFGEFLFDTQESPFFKKLRFSVDSFPSTHVSIPFQ